MLKVNSDLGRGGYENFINLARGEVGGPAAPVRGHFWWTSRGSDQEGSVGVCVCVCVRGPEY